MMNLCYQCQNTGLQLCSMGQHNFPGHDQQDSSSVACGQWPAAFGLSHSHISSTQHASMSHMRYESIGQHSSALVGPHQLVVVASSSIGSSKCHPSSIAEYASVKGQWFSPGSRCNVLYPKDTLGRSLKRLYPTMRSFR